MQQSCHPRPIRRSRRRSLGRGRGPRCLRLVLVAAVYLIPLFVGANATTDPVSDSDLVARANAVMSVKEAPPDRMLGVHKGAPVIVDIRCGDVCPQYTVRIIHYTVDVGPTCTKLGGDIAVILVPVSIASVTQKFCIPHVLYQQKLYVDHPFQK